VSALNGRASAYKFARRIPEALKDWQRAIEIKADFIDGYFNLAVTYLQIGERKKALIYLNTLQNKYSEKLSLTDRGKLQRLIRQAGG
jgi:tetratricopeptide (TPR) repeat protein